MKYGAVASPFPNNGGNNPPDGTTATDAAVADKRRKLDLMGATTVRVSLFWNNSWGQRFTSTQLDTLRLGGRAEMILQSRENPDLNSAQHELNDVILPYVRVNGSTLFVYEIGNEPNEHGESATDARRRRLEISQYLWGRKNNGTLPGNFLWAIDMPSQRGTADYFNAFVLDPGDNYGNLLNGPNAPQVITVHCYGFGTLCRSDGQQPYQLIDWVRGWTDRNIKVTEAGIWDGTPNILPDNVRGPRYVEFAEKLTLPQTPTRGGGGNIDSVCFYGTPDVGAYFNISDSLASAIGSRASANDCG